MRKKKNTPEAVSSSGQVHLHQHRSVQHNVVQDSRQLHLHEHRNLQQSVQLIVGLDPVDVAQQAGAYDAEVANQARAFKAFLEQFKHETERERERELLWRAPIVESKS